MDVVALGELLIDLTQNGMSEQGNPILEANPGGAPCNVLALLAKLGHKHIAIIGGVLAVIILLLFLGNVRTSLSIGVSMPISIIVTFIAMFFADMSLNVVSLGGLALGVGMLVDNSVVLLENIFQRTSKLFHLNS